MSDLPNGVPDSFIEVQYIHVDGVQLGLDNLQARTFIHQSVYEDTTSSKDFWDVYQLEEGGTLRHYKVNLVNIGSVRLMDVKVDE